MFPIFYVLFSIFLKINGTSKNLIISAEICFHFPNMQVLSWKLPRGITEGFDICYVIQEGLNVYISVVGNFPWLVNVRLLCDVLLTGYFVTVASHVSLGFIFGGAFVVAIASVSVMQQIVHSIV